MSFTGELKGLSKPDGMALVKNQYGIYFNIGIDLLEKPKTPEEELLDDLKFDIGFLSSTYEKPSIITEKLLEKYDIKKKPQ